MRDSSVCDFAAHRWFTSSTLCCRAYMHSYSEKTNKTMPSGFLCEESHGCTRAASCHAGPKSLAQHTRKHGEVGKLETSGTLGNLEKLESWDPNLEKLKYICVHNLDKWSLLSTQATCALGSGYPSQVQPEVLIWSCR